jgi:hypothetical protein
MAPRSTLVRLDGKNDEWIPEKALARARLRAAELGGVYDWWHSLDAPDNRTPKERERERGNPSTWLNALGPALII